MLKKIIKFLKKPRKKVSKKPKNKKILKKKITRKIIKNRKLKVIKTASKKIKAEKGKIIAVPVHYFSKIKVAVIKLKGQLKINDKIRIKGFTTDFTQNITSMQIDHKSIDAAKKGQEVGLLVKQKVRHNDKVYKIAP